jgi:hypothetical protein
MNRHAVALFNLILTAVTEPLCVCACLQALRAAPLRNSGDTI